MLNFAAVPHEPGACRSRTHCWSCGTDEPDEPCYQSCLECGHIYRTEQELVDAHNKIINELNAQHDHHRECDPLWCGPIPCVTGAGQIFHCALCLHDF
jgi:hypothetical protein